MKKSLIISILILLVIVVVGWLVISNKENKDVMQQNDQTMQTSDSLTTEQKEAMIDEDKSVSNTSNQATVKEVEQKEIVKTESAPAVKETVAKVGSYELYSPQKISKALTGNVVLFFKASWCPSCRAVYSDIQAHLKDIPSDLTILEVDYDNSSALKAKYGVTYQHTFVQVDSNGGLIKKWQGSPTLASIVKEIK